MTPTLAPGRGVASRERSALADTLARIGPGAPTLCAGWDAAHLAAHLVLRDRRPDLQLTTLLTRSSERLTDALDSLATGTPWPRLVESVRRVPLLNPTRLRFLDDRINTVEFAVHHEDLRRASAGWTARTLDPALTAGIWASLPTVSRLTSRGIAVPVVLRDPAGRSVKVRHGRGEPVEVTGEPLELALFIVGRSAVADVELSGPADDVTRLRETRLAL